ncbi:AMP-binding protein [Methylobacterium sp. J-001]|uniref:AMP-binding protein n=1 Tax=Methylobacterium sp. J-001 TaxID=2836609 RepID=UPI001FB99130|nr:AMP-binding protein [Methylobacterium sp. J-001]MCJ2120614.1 AMP-binding protein [Methylobacterium sp. J-001]
MDVLERVLYSAAKYHACPAIVTEYNTLTYAELIARAYGFAACFAKSALDPKVLVGLPQSADAYAAILGAGLAGGIYTPLNLSAPPHKLKRIASLLQPDVIVASSPVAEILKDAAPRADLIDPGSVPPLSAAPEIRPRNERAYILFTSGSTGDPKGVVIPRAAFNNYVDWLETFNITSEDRCSQHANLAFDISATDIYGALCFGASLHPLVSNTDRLMPARMIAREGITIWNSVPSVISLMMQGRQLTSKNLASVRLFNFIGEPLLPQQVEALFEAAPRAKIQNTYGPTEATVSLTELPLTRENLNDVSRASVALGNPIPNTGLILVGGSHPDEGEIVLLGTQLAEGYLNDPEKTAKSFRMIELGGRKERAYFTGDLAERINGNIYFKERADFQVKIKGYRIELDEIAAAIRSAGWLVPCVIKRDETLVAIVESHLGMTLDEASLRDQLALLLEPHAVPEAIYEIERMPRNENDKIDRRAAAVWLDNHLSRVARR